MYRYGITASPVSSIRPWAHAPPTVPCGLSYASKSVVRRPGDPGHRTTRPSITKRPSELVGGDVEGQFERLLDLLLDLRHQPGQPHRPPEHLVEQFAVDRPGLAVLAFDQLLLDE